MKAINWVSIYRAAVWVVVGIMLLMVWSQSPSPDSSAPSPSEFTNLLETATEDKEVNDARAQGAPQQQVVNGWHSHDLQEITILQNTMMLTNQEAQRQAITSASMLLLVLGLGLCADRVGSSLLRVRRRPAFVAGGAPQQPQAPQGPPPFTGPAPIQAYPDPHGAAPQTRMPPAPSGANPFAGPQTFSNQQPPSTPQPPQG